MKATGIVRRVDDLGRIVIPKEIRRTLRILLVIIDKYADDFRGILRQKDPRHTGDILPLFKQRHDAFYRFI